MLNGLLKIVVLVFVSTYTFELEKLHAQVLTSEVSVDEDDYNEPDTNPEYGSFMIMLGFDFPEYTELDGYKDFYGDPSIRFNFGVDFYPLAFTYGALGLGFKLDAFNDKGNPKYLQDGQLLTDDGSKITLNTRQYELLGSLLLSPFRSQVLVFRFFGGIGYLDFTEGRSSGSANSVSVKESPDLENADDIDRDKKTYVNEGGRTISTLGLSMMVDITPLEESTVYSMIATLGIDKVYMAPYITNTIDLSVEDGKADFTNLAYGLMFKFEAEH